MDRKIASAEEIQKQIEKRIESVNDRLENFSAIKVQLPERRTPDESGCNWDVTFISVCGAPLKRAYQAAADVKQQGQLQE
jgi:hypothetical protein